jgi:integrase
MTGERFVFAADPDGAEPWRPNWVTKRFIALRTAAGVGRFRLHDLRHFMATEMLHRLVPLPTVSGRLAHARMSTTLNVYAHAVPSGDRLAATVIGNLVVGTPKRQAGATSLRPSTPRHARWPTRRTSRCRGRPPA